MFLERRFDSSTNIEVERSPQSFVARVTLQALQHVFENFPDFEIEEDLSVTWEKKERDFETLLKVKNIIDLDLSDEEFNRQIHKIKRILVRTDIFRRLDDKDIKVSHAHTGVTPFKHTLNAVKGLVTNGLPKEMVRAIRWATIWHDIGKIFGADIQFGRFHSQLSVQICWEFFYTHCKDLSPELIQQMLFAIQFHHTSEGFSLKWLGSTDDEVEKEARNRLQKWEVVVMLYVMSAADILSIAEYQGHVEKLNGMMKELQPKYYQAINALGLFRTVLREPDTESNEADGNDAEPAESLVQ